MSDQTWQQWVKQYVNQTQQQESDRIWKQIDTVMQEILMEILEVKTLAQAMETGDVPPSKDVEEMIDRLAALEEDHVQLKSEVKTQLARLK